MTKGIKDYADDILQTHDELNGLIDCHPDYDKTNARLSRQLTKWSNLLNISVQVANNETTPWLESEIKLRCIPMQQKKDTKYRQTGDYVAYLDDYDMFVGLCVERKTREDLYGTLMNKERRERLYREISRYESDPRFNLFMLIAECNYEEFLQYVPEIFVFSHDSAEYTRNKNIIRYFKRFYKIDVQQNQIKEVPDALKIDTGDHQMFLSFHPGGASVLVDGVLRETLVKRINLFGKTQYYVHRGACEASKIETMNSLENRIQVSFVGSRGRAVEKYSGFVRQWCRRNYVKILDTDK